MVSLIDIYLIFVLLTLNRNHVVHQCFKKGQSVEAVSKMGENCASWLDKEDPQGGTVPKSQQPMETNNGTHNHN
jgi:hypothetical protein